MNSDDQSVFLVDCPHCDQSMRVDVDAIGRAGLCPACGQRVAVVSVRAGTATDSRLDWIASLSTSGSDSAGPWASNAARPSASAAKSSSVETGTSDAAQTLGRFLLQRKLGQGGFGEVWLAEDTQLKRLVALKLPRFATHDEKRKRRFLAESRTAAVLRHPNIVPVLDAGTIGQTHFIASEFVRGVPLDDIHKDRKASVQWTVKTLIKLARATHFAHQHQIVHRDLKPDNVLIDQQGEPQVLDFGLAKRLDDTESRTMDGTVMGTPHYMSPEQARGEIQRVGPASDQFSLGVILYRLLSGQTPHSGQPLVVLKQLITHPTPSLGAVEQSFAADLIAICDKARAAEIEDRYADCGALADDLQRFADGWPVTAAPPSTISRATKWIIKHPRESTLAGICMAAALLLFSVSLMGWRRAQRAANQATITEGQLREETTRLVSLENDLSVKVNEAAQLRDRTATAQQRAVAARQQLETETERLNQQTLQAEQSLAKLQQTTQQLTTEQQRQQALETTLADAVQTIDTTTSNAQQIRSTATDAPRIDSQFTTAEKALLVGDKELILCKVDSEAFVLRPANKRMLTAVSRVSNVKHIEQICFDANKQIVGSWGNGMSDQMGIATLDTDNRWVPLVPIRFSREMFLLRQQALGLPQYRAKLEQGILEFFNGECAIDQEDRIYVLSNGYVIRFDPEQESFEIVLQQDNLSHIHFCLDDPSAIYLTRRQGGVFVERRELGEGSTTPGTVALGLQSSLGTLRTAIPLGKDQWFVQFGEERLVRIDLQAKTYQRIGFHGKAPRSRGTLRWTVAPNGNYISIDFESITFYQADDSP